MKFPPQPPPSDTPLLNLLNSRRDIASLIHLQDGRVLEVFDIAWSYDPGEAEALITTNCSPPRPHRPIHLIHSNEIMKIVDPVTRSVLFAAEE